MRSRGLPLAVVLGLALGACGSSNSASSTSSSTTNAAAGSGTTPKTGNSLATQRAPGVGAVLTSGQGRTLYVYMPEKGGTIKCVSSCAAVWPLLTFRGSGKPEATSAVHPNLIGTMADSTGATVITYAGWPLHVYASDTGRGSYKGQGVGGQWYMISPSGQVTTKPVSSSSGSGGGSVY